jgi:glycosyltransferase involved in cell wall biosynthesis
VSISDNQRKPLALGNWIETVHHGIPAGLYAPPIHPKGDYLAFIGRISPEKRPDRAISIARRAGMKLRIAAKVDPADMVYFRKEIEPLLGSPEVEFIGEIGDAQKSDFIGNARALLFPIDWPEPFGLVMIEAMACGTPVIAWNCGSVPEVIDHGRTGFIVSSEDEALAAVEAVGGLDRAQVRAVFEERFSAPIMAGNYVDIYKRLLARSRMPGALRVVQGS